MNTPKPKESRFLPMLTEEQRTMLARLQAALKARPLQPKAEECPKLEHQCD